MRSKFPNVVAAVAAREQHLSRTEGQDLWAIGDALVKDVVRADGRPSATRFANDGSREQLGVCAEELAKLGYAEYSTVYLSQILAAAEAFPKSRRYPEITVSAHIEAGNPEILDWIVKSAKGKRVSRVYARQMVSLWQERHAAKQRAKEEETGVFERSPTKRDLPPPSEDEIPVVAKELSLLQFAREAKERAASAASLAAEANDQIDDVMLDVTRGFVEFATQEALAAAKALDDAAVAWRDVSKTIRKTSSDKRGHLAVVGE